MCVSSPSFLISLFCCASSYRRLSLFLPCTSFIYPLVYVFSSVNLFFMFGCSLLLSCHILMHLFCSFFLLLFCSSSFLLFSLLLTYIVVLLLSPFCHCIVSFCFFSFAYSLLFLSVIVFFQGLCFPLRPQASHFFCYLLSFNLFSPCGHCAVSFRFFPFTFPSVFHIFYWNNFQCLYFSTFLSNLRSLLPFLGVVVSCSIFHVVAVSSSFFPFPFAYSLLSFPESTVGCLCFPIPPQASNFPSLLSLILFSPCGHRVVSFVSFPSPFLCCSFLG